MPAPEALVDILRQRSVRFGTFPLASGRTSDLYVDARVTTLHPEGIGLIAEAILERLQPEVVAVGGPVTGADPITGALVLRSQQLGRPLCGFMVRKAAKAHGRGKQVEGLDNIEAGSPVCVIEDTVTTGGSLLDAVQAVEAAGLRVVQVIVVVDREEGGADRVRSAGYPYEALVGRRDLEAP